METSNVQCRETYIPKTEHTMPPLRLLETQSECAWLPHIENCLDQQIPCFHSASRLRDLTLKQAGARPPLILHNHVGGHLAMEKGDHR